MDSYRRCATCARKWGWIVREGCSTYWWPTTFTTDRQLSHLLWFDRCGLDVCNLDAGRWPRCSNAVLLREAEAQDGDGLVRDVHFL
jgi:hypothetical protein